MHLYGFTVLDGSCADCKEAIHLIKNINTRLVFIDCIHDINEILSCLNKQNIKSGIPPKCNRIYQHDYERKLYRFRYVIEDTFFDLKCWCTASIRCAKTFDVLIVFAFISCTLSF